MGCDIHFFTERYTSDNNYEGPKDISERRDINLEDILEDSGIKSHPRWVSGDKGWDNSDGYWEVSEIYNNRSYDLFGLLADVRGEGPCITGEPRGIPDDASYGYKCIVDQWGRDGHSHSYITLSELLDIDWDIYESYGVSTFKTTIEQMKLIDPNPDNVRCVFFFDN